jgi:hypothetical protein
MKIILTWIITTALFLGIFTLFGTYWGAKEGDGWDSAGIYMITAAITGLFIGIIGGLTDFKHFKHWRLFKYVKENPTWKKE